jgi:hypothetical protein
MSRGLEIGAVFIAASAIVALAWLPNRVIQPKETEAALPKLEADNASE